MPPRSTADQVRDAIEGLDWIGRRHMIRTLVAKIEIDEDGATVVYRSDRC